MPAAEKPTVRTVLRRLGPGLITGAADDDPSGVATYSQAGAQFGLNMLWTSVVTYPMMVAVQLVSARIGSVTGKGLAANLCEVAPRPVVMALVGLLLVANTINIGANIAAMGAAAALLTGGGAALFALAFAAISLGLQLFVPYHRYVRVLKWLTLALLTYLGVVLTVNIEWAKVATRIVAPELSFTPEAVTMVVALFGTTISPYLFFWQSSEEVEELEAKGEPPLKQAPAPAAREELRWIRWDTLTGMALSNLIAFFVILTAAVALHDHGVGQINSAADAAEALRPIAGPAAFALFSIGIIGTGLLAVPVLAGSAAYAVADVRGWDQGLEKRPSEAKGFYGVIAAAVVVSLVMVFLPVDPMRLLFWSAVINGVVAVPVMAAMMLVVGRVRVMGRLRATLTLQAAGWVTTLVMGAAAVAMLWPMIAAALSP